MYSPILKPEQHSPMMSPMAFHLDENNGSNNIQNLLLSPTKLKLDSVGNSSVYRTSLSKLNELTRNGRSRQRRNSDTLRSNSPIRFPLLNNLAPKMLKPEYINSQTSSLPLLSALMKQTANASSNSANNGNSNYQLDASRQSNNTNDTNSNPFFSRMSIKETLEQLNIHKQRQKKNTQEREPVVQVRTVNNSDSTPMASKNDITNPGTGSVFPETTALRKISNTDSTFSDSTLNDNSSLPESQIEPLKIDTKINEVISPTTQVLRNPPRKNFNVQTPNLHQSEFDSIPQELNVDLLPTDNNGFVQLNSNKNNRYSFMSSTSTDFEIDWYSQLQLQQNLQLQQPSPRFPAQSESDESVQNERRIKRLELEITELKLQNEKLIQSITTTHHSEGFSTNGKAENSYVTHHKKKTMQYKVRNLEKKLESYKTVMNKLVDMHTSLHGDDFNDETSSVKTRISRISDRDLKKIEESGSSSSCGDENEEEAKNDDDENDGNDSNNYSSSYENFEILKKHEDISYANQHQLRQQTLQKNTQDPIVNKMFSVGSKRKVGFQLNIQIKK